MHFDDRLGTVLRMRADGGGMQRIQFRQLLDLLGTMPAEARGEQLDAAFVRLGELSNVISEGDRAAILREPALRLRSPRLVAALATGSSKVAATALQRARLTTEQWIDLIPALPPAARPALRQRQDLDPAVMGLLLRLGVTDRSLPPASQPAELAISAPANGISPTGELSPADPELADDEVLELEVVAADPARTDDGIGAIVRRIEAYRRAKQVIDLQPANDSPRLPLGEEHMLEVPAEVRGCDFATDAAGTITWCDAGVAPMLIGTSITRAAQIDALFRRHQPIAAQRLDLRGAPAISGAWQVDAAPWFDPLSGRFVGYRGRLRRPVEAPAASTNAPVRDSEADRIRQMLHELRTPVNAIQVGSEIIQQQLFGPAPHEYRALAASIAGDAARMLSAFEELERLAKLDSGAMELEPGSTDLAAVIAASTSQLAAHTKSRSSGFSLRIDDRPLPVALAPLEVERIVWRLLATLAGTSAPGEMLKLRLRSRGAMVRIDAALPASLAAREGDDLFRAAAGAVPQVIAAGVFGVGFALRLARAEARAAGGDLLRKGDRLRLVLPGLTGALPSHTEGTNESAG